MMNNRAIFLDRDGTLNEEVGSIMELAQFRLYDFAAESIKLINEAGWLAVVITNQAGVARGHYSEEFLGQVHQRMESALLEQGARLDAIYYCPHHPEFGEPPYRRDCHCRKPRPGMMERAAQDFSLDLKECYVIGDRRSDVETGQAAGARSVLVLTGHGREEYSVGFRTDHVCENLLEAVRWILCN